MIKAQAKVKSIGRTGGTGAAVMSGFVRKGAFTVVYQYYFRWHGEQVAWWQLRQAMYSNRFAECMRPACGGK